MFLCFFATFAAAKFINYKISDRLFIETVNQTGIEKIVNEHSTVVALAADAEDSHLINSYVHLEPLYPDAHFAVVHTKDMDKFLDGKCPSYPFISIIRDKTVEITFGPIRDDNTMMYLIDLWLTKQRKVLSDQTALVAAFGGAPRTLIMREKDFQKGLDIAKITSITIGPANVVLVDESLAKIIGMKQSDCGLYRRDDAFLTVVRGCNAESYKRIVRPDFGPADRLTKKSKELVVAFRTNRGSRNPESPVFSILGQLGGHFKDMKFVIADKEFAKTVKDFTKEDDWDATETNVAVMDFKNGWYYNTSSVFTPSMKNETFDPQLWGNNLASFLYQVKNHAIPKSYISEKPASKSDDLMQKAVGKDIKKRLEEADTDVFVLYLKPKCPPCSKLFSKVKGLVDKLEDLNYTDARILIYDVESNQHAGGNAVNGDQAPTLFMYPVNDKKNPKVCPYASDDVVTWFAAKYAAKPHNLTYTLPNSNKMQQIEEEAGKLARKLGGKLGDAVRQQLADLKADAAPAEQQNEL